MTSFLVSTVEGGNFRLSLADGGELEVQSTTGGGVGTVSSVTGAAPIIAAPTTGDVVVSIDASYPAVADFWPFDRTIPKTVTSPTLSQANQTDATVPPTIVAHASNAFAGSGNSGGTWNFVVGINDTGAAPARFRIFQARTGEGANNAIMMEAFFVESTAVQSIGFGDPSHSIAGTQVVLQGAGNSVVAHATIGMFALDNATTGQAFIQLHDVDGLGLLPGAFNAQYDVFTSGTQPDVGWYQLRKEHTVGSGGSFFTQIQNGTPGTPVNRYTLAELHATGGGTIAQAKLALYDNNGATALGKTSLAVPWADSSLGAAFQGILVQRDSGNANDLGLWRRLLGNLYAGDQTDPAQLRIEANTSVFFETGVAGGGWTWQNNSLGVQLQVSTDTARTITSHGDVANGHDGYQTQKYGTNVASTVGATLATVALPTGLGTFAGVTVTARVVGVDQTTGDTGTVKLTNSFSITGGAATLLTGTDGPTDQGHSAAAAAFAASAAFTASGGNAVLKANTWGANAIHFEVIIEMVVNTGTA